MASAALAVAGPAVAQSRAGTMVVNVAQARASVGDAVVATSSNAASFLVAERLDLTLDRPDRAIGASADGVRAIPVVLTNRGNGQEAFSLAIQAADGISSRGIAIDADGDGAFNPARDTPLTGGAVPAMSAGAAIPLLILVEGSGGTVTLVARAATGSGAPGQVFAGAGDGGGDAVTGATGAEARLTIPLDGAASPSLRKTQSVQAPDGTERPLPGAVVTYTLEATFPGARRAVRIEDRIPSGTRYLPGSLSLDGAALTDAADDDAGAFDGSAISVALGDVPVPGAVVTRTVRFQAVLQ